jgi:transposase-like protein
VCKLAEAGALTHKELGAKFDIAPNLISKWVAARRSDGAEAFRGRGIRTEIEAENARLRKENSDLKLEREILKKSSGVLRQAPSVRCAFILNSAVAGLKMAHLLEITLSF